MRGQRTLIILGAGASACYSGAPNGVPTQTDILGRISPDLFTSSGVGAPTLNGPHGLAHSFELGQYLHARFNLTESEDPEVSKLEFWKKLEARGLSLESLYCELEADQDCPRHLLEEFQAIIRTAVVTPVGDRAPDRVCATHAHLVESLEPGDCVVDFNWDTVMADALFYRSHFWFPRTGFGLPVTTFHGLGQKGHKVNSLVQLLHPHGSVALFEPVGDPPGRPMLFAGPQQIGSATGLFAIAGIVPPPDGDGQPTRQYTDEELHRVNCGWLMIRYTWFRPVFLPPGREKQIAPTSTSYLSMVRGTLHSALPSISRVVVAGYSFPDADRAHLKRLFVSDVMSDDVAVTCVNPQNDSASFRSRVRKVFRSLRHFDFNSTDFKTFCESLHRA